MANPPVLSADRRTTSRLHVLSRGAGRIPGSAADRRPARPAEQVSAWQQALAKEFRFATMVLALPGELEDLPDTFSKLATPVVNAWVCEGVTCLSAISDLDALLHACSANGLRAAMG